MPLLMTLKYIWRSFCLSCHFHVHFSYPWHAFASHGLPATAELLVKTDFDWTEFCLPNTRVVIRRYQSMLQLHSWCKILTAVLSRDIMDLLGFENDGHKPWRPKPWWPQTFFSEFGDFLKVCHWFFTFSLLWLSWYTLSYWYTVIVS